MERAGCLHRRSGGGFHTRQSGQIQASAFYWEAPDYSAAGFYPVAVFMGGRQVHHIILRYRTRKRRLVCAGNEGHPRKQTRRPVGSSVFRRMWQAAWCIRQAAWCSRWRAGPSHDACIDLDWAQSDDWTTGDSDHWLGGDGRHARPLALAQLGCDLGKNGKQRDLGQEKGWWE